MRQLRLLDVGLSLLRKVFKPRTAHVSFVVKEVVLGLVSLGKF
jgi:hypothetical protein